MKPIESFYEESRVKAKTRAAILDAAALLFYQAGLAELTMQAVAQKAGLTPRNLYRYYETRNLLVIDTIYYAFSLFEEDPPPSLDAADSGWKQLEKVVEGYYLDPYQYTAAKGLKVGEKLGLQLETGTTLRLQFEIDYFILGLPKEDPAFVRYTQLYVANMGVDRKRQMRQALTAGARDGSLRITEDEVPFYMEFIPQVMRSIGAQVMLKGHERSSINFSLVQKTAEVVLAYLKG